MNAQPKLLLVNFADVFLSAPVRSDNDRTTKDQLQEIGMKRQLRNAAIGLVGALAVVPVYAQSLADNRNDWHMGWGYGHMVFGSLMMLLFWGAVVVAIVVAVRWIGSHDHRSRPQSSESRARAILEERFARGEIDKDEFEERKRSLSS